MNRGPDSSRDRNTPYLALLVEDRPGGHKQIHAGLARHGLGTAMCSDRPLFEWQHAARAEGFELYRTNGWRHRWAEAYLELNRGCSDCLTVLYAIGDEAGYGRPKSLRTS